MVMLVGECGSCNYKTEIPVTDEQLTKFNEGELIQKVLPNVSPGDRELFISGMCGDCFDRIFA